MDTMALEKATATQAGGRRRRTMEEKRRIVEETLAPGASLALIARRHEVNANLLFSWRRLYHQGLLQGSSETTVATLVAVSEAPSSASPATRFGQRKSATARSPGTIEIEFPGGQKVRVTGPVDPTVLGQLISVLARR
jgi:transposase